MYWGSVRFFKHLILLFFFGALACSVGLCVFWGLRYGQMRTVYNQAEQNMTELIQSNDQDNTAIQSLAAGDPTLFLALCAEKGMTGESLKQVLTLRGEASSAELPDYTSLYPGLYTEPPASAESSDKTAYLTFDDGPDPENTVQILDTLKKYGVKATFFVCPKADGSDGALLRRIVNEGHSLGIHSGSHVYTEIYQDVPSFLEDFSLAWDRVYAATGTRPDIFRFPGGSINAYNRLHYRDLISEMTRRGFTYYDWNVSGNEEGRGLTSAVIARSVLEQSADKNRAFILLHDGGGRSTTAQATGAIIEGLQGQGFRLDRITNTVKPVIMGYG